MTLHGLQVPPLPHPLTLLVGRERDVTDVITLLAQDGVRLITLTGVGGVGKSRVALEVAHEIGSFFSDRVFLIDFASVGDPTLLAPTIAVAVGLAPPTDGSSLMQLKLLIGEQRALIVVDNIDRVAASASPLTELLGACPHLAILATSRSRLRLHGEVVRQVLPLPVLQPGDGVTVENANALPAVRMFIERGREVDHRFALTAENVTDVSAIVRRLDGLPLAIELAAARLDLLSPAALLTRLEQRLPLLTGGAHDLPGRLRTMHDAIAWSYDLLERDEREVFERLALFADSIPLAGAVAICGDGDELAVLALLASLADKSLLIRDPEATGEPRFRMLPTIREFALGQLRRNSAEDDAMCRLASWCLRRCRGGGSDAGEDKWDAAAHRPIGSRARHVSGCACLDGRAGQGRRFPPSGRGPRLVLAASELPLGRTSLARLGHRPGNRGGNPDRCHCPRIRRRRRFGPCTG